MSVRLVPAVFVPCMLLATFVHPAHASRAELDARALPRLLAVDPTNVLVLPASLGGLPRQAELDYTGLDEDRFALGMAGGGTTRFAYVLDGESHNLCLGGTSWGVVLGFQDSYVNRVYQNTNLSESFYYSDLTENKQSRRTVRLGLGWRHELGQDYVLQVGVGGRWINAETSVEDYSVVNSDSEYFTFSATSEPGWGVDGTLQILGLRSGLLLGLGYAYSDLSPDVTTEPPFQIDVRDRTQAALLNVGWRFRSELLDDLSAGWSFSWVDDWYFPPPSSSPYVGQKHRTTYLASIFLSGEKHVWKGFTVLGGVRGPFSFVKDIETSIRFNGGAPYEAYRREYDTGGVESPEIRLGVTWAWRSLVLTGQIRESISTDGPLARWAATITY